MLFRLHDHSKESSPAGEPGAADASAADAADVVIGAAEAAGVRREYGRRIGGGRGDGGEPGVPDSWVEQVRTPEGTAVLLAPRSC
jgi:hypothetical protein